MQPDRNNNRQKKSKLSKVTEIISGMSKKSIFAMILMTTLTTVTFAAAPLLGLFFMVPLSAMTYGISISQGKRNIEKLQHKQAIKDKNNEHELTKQTLLQQIKEKHTQNTIDSPNQTTTDKSPKTQNSNQELPTTQTTPPTKSYTDKKHAKQDKSASKKTTKLTKQELRQEQKKAFTQKEEDIFTKYHKILGKEYDLDDITSVPHNKVSNNNLPNKAANRTTNPVGNAK